MKRMILALAVAVAFTSMVFAQANTPKKEATSVAKKVEELKIIGQVASVDAIANTITLKTKTGEETLPVDKAAKIMAEGKECKLADLTKGSEVAVHYKMEAGKKVAVMIHVLPKKAEAIKKEVPKKIEKAEPATPVKKEAVKEVEKKK
jgi:hypothetical protein